MVTIEDAKEQIARLDATQDFQWKTAEARAELTSVLIQNATTEDEARRAISSWLSEEQHCPTPSDLLTALRGARQDATPAATRNAFAFSGGCRICHGTGYVSIYQLCTTTLGKILAQDIPGGRVEAQALGDRWESERRAWIADNPTGRYKPDRSQFIGESGRKCRCGA
jgi:hypothetical protein